MFLSTFFRESFVAAQGEGEPEPSINGVGYDELTAAQIRSDLQSALQDTQKCGLMLWGDGIDSKLDVTAKVLEEIFGNDGILRISGSSYSRRIPLGALLFLVSDISEIETKSDIEIFLELKKKIIGSGPKKAALVSQATNLDERSTQILCQLASVGAIYLVLLNDDVETIGTAFRHLINKQELHVVGNSVFSRTAMSDYLSKRLNGYLTPRVIASYWLKSRGDLEKIEQLLRQDLDTGRLSQISGVWVFVGSGSTSDGRTEEFFDTWTQMGTRAGAEITSSDSFGILNSKVRPQGNAALAWQPSKTVLESRRENLNVLLDALAAGEFDYAHRVIQEFESEMLDVDDASLTEVASSVELVKQIIGLHVESPQEKNDHCQDIYLEQNRTFNWFSSIAQGIGLETPYVDTSDAGITACVSDIRWSNESDQILGVLCVAHQWSVQGYRSSANKLLTWATRQMERFSMFQNDASYRILFPCMVFLAHDVAFRLYNIDLSLAIDSLVLDGPQADATAILYTFVFAGYRAIRVADIDLAEHMACLVEANGSGIELVARVPLIGQLAVFLMTLKSEDQEHELVVGLEKFNELPVSNHEWMLTILFYQLRLALGTGKVNSQRIHELALLAHSKNKHSSTFELCALQLAAGNELAPEVFSETMARGTNDMLCSALISLKNTIVDDDGSQQLKARFKLAQLGQGFQIAALLHGETQIHSMLTRRVHRALESYKQSVTRFGTKPRTYTDFEGSNEQMPWAQLLTSREKTIAKFAASGLRNSEIASLCQISVRTVEGHLYQVHAKLNIRNRRELTALVNLDKSVDEI